MGFEEKENVKSFVCLTMWAPKESFWETNSRAGGVSPRYNNLASLDCFRSFLHIFSLWPALAECFTFTGGDKSSVSSSLRVEEKRDPRANDLWS
jgi:hypothetical protein